MRNSIPHYNHMMEPLLKVLEKVYKAAGGRTKRRAQRILLSELECSTAKEAALEEVNRSGPYGLLESPGLQYYTLSMY